MHNIGTIPDFRVLFPVHYTIWRIRKYLCKIWQKLYSWYKELNDKKLL